MFFSLTMLNITKDTMIASIMLLSMLIQIKGDSCLSGSALVPISHPKKIIDDQEIILVKNGSYILKMFDQRKNTVRVKFD